MAIQEAYPRFQTERGFVEFTNIPTPPVRADFLKKIFAISAVGFDFDDLLVRRIPKSLLLKMFYFYKATILGENDANSIYESTFQNIPEAQFPTDGIESSVIDLIYEFCSTAHNEQRRKEIIQTLFNLNTHVFFGEFEKFGEVEKDHPPTTFLEVMPGVTELLLVLQKKNVPFFIVSNSSLDRLLKRMEILGPWANKFSQVVSARHGDFPKPSGVALTYALANLGIHQQEVAYIGNALGDVHAAAEAQIGLPILISPIKSYFGSLAPNYLGLSSLHGLTNLINYVH